jgi:hypothetical protein
VGEPIGEEDCVVFVEISAVEEEKELRAVSGDGGVFLPEGLNRVGVT